MTQTVTAVCCSLILLCACGSSTRRQVTADMQHVIGSAVCLPVDLQANIMDQDTMLSISDTSIDATVLIYYDAEGCTPCRLKELHRWRPLMDEITLDTNSRSRFVFILDATRISIREIQWNLICSLWHHPVYLDTAGIFERMNPGLPGNPVFHTFLLDRDNRVVLVGSPIGNPKMWELYKTTIARLVENGGTLPAEQ